MKKNNLSLLFSLILMMISIYMTYSSFFLFMLNKTIMVEIDLMNQINSFTFSYLVLLDWMSTIFISIVSLISSVVMLYSYSYMFQDPHKNSFYTLVLLFVISMFLMVMSPQMLSILLGWDGLGLVSYCLVIYYNNYKSQNAGMVTFMSNRIGDLGIIISISWLMNFGSMDFFMLQYSYNYGQEYLFYIIMIAAMTKSAQIPFSAWLPAAMAAPTPVSSLVHSSTLVTAGVYLLIRFNFLIISNFYLLLFSSLTMIMSGISALFEMDMKKVIALSTLSQLGVMMFALSVGLKELAFFHLLTHALFKSLLFLCAGFYIHSNLDWQDIRSYTALNKHFPLMSLYFSVASLALSGFPFLAGFYSKDSIIEMFLISDQNLYILIILLLATCLTLIYSVRLIYLTFLKKLNFSSTFSSPNEDFIMAYPMFILFTLSVLGGSSFSWNFFPQVFISLSLANKMLVLMLLVTVFMLISTANKKLFTLTSKLVYFFSLMWLTPTLTLNMMIYFLYKSLNYLKLMDQGWLELIGGQGSFKLMSNQALKLDTSQLLNIKNLLFIMLLIIIVMMSF